MCTFDIFRLNHEMQEISYGNNGPFPHFSTPPFVSFFLVVATTVGGGGSENRYLNSGVTFNSLRPVTIFPGTQSVEYVRTGDISDFWHVQE